MAESLFDIFGDHHNRNVIKNVTRQPFSNIEKSGKTVSLGPIKPNEPMKKGGEPKKSFLSNTGKALQSTPARKVFTPRANNVASMIYTDDDKGFKMEEVEFTKPAYKYDHHYKELFDYLLPEPTLDHDTSPPTPPQETKKHSMELDLSYHDDFFTDEFSLDSLQDDNLGLPDLYD